MYDRRKDMTKKKWKELQKQNRAANGFNTGTRDMKSEKYPTRAEQKENIRREVKNYVQNNLLEYQYTYTNKRIWFYQMDT